MEMFTNAQKEAVGIRVVATFVREPWNCRWQEYEARNDNGIDGVIIMRKGEHETGGLAFVQVKCGGNGYRVDQQQYPEMVGVNLGKTYLDEHKPRWLTTPGPCLIVFVDDTINKITPPAWWADLKSPATYSPTNSGLLLIPKAQRFGSHTKGDFHKLCGAGPVDKVLPVLHAEREDLVIPASKETLHNAARGFYQQWSKLTYPNTNPALGKVLINRVGWRHITSQGRLRERQFQSLSLLGIAKRMIDELDDITMLGRVTVHDYADGGKKVTDHLGLRANIVFPHRHQSVVQVVLRRDRIITKDPRSPTQEKIWFLSVYELRRGAMQI
jgi:hypothetical protein